MFFWDVEIMLFFDVGREYDKIGCFWCEVGLDYFVWLELVWKEMYFENVEWVCYWIDEFVFLFYFLVDEWYLSYEMVVVWVVVVIVVGEGGLIFVICNIINSLVIFI